MVTATSDWTKGAGNSAKTAAAASELDVATVGASMADAGATGGCCAASAGEIKPAAVSVGAMKEWREASIL